MKYLLNQRIATSKKNKEWRKEMLDYYVDLSYDWYDEWVRMEENYSLKNNQLNREEITEICKGLGSEENTEIFVNAYNKTHNIIDAHKGEEWNRPFAFSVINNSKKAINSIERNKRNDIEKLSKEVFKLEYDRQRQIFDLEVKQMQGSLSKEDFEKAAQELSDRFDRYYGSISDPKKIFDKYENVNTAEEIAIERIMRMMIERQNIKFIKNQTFEDALLAGREAVEIYKVREEDLPKVKQLNPLNLFFEKSPDVMWIQDGDYAGYRELMSLEKIVEEFGDLLNDEDYKKLIDTGAYAGKVKGINHPFTASKRNPQPSQDKEINSFRDIPKNNSGDIESYIFADERYGHPNNSYIGSSHTNRIGLSAVSKSKSYTRDYTDVYTVYWKSQRKIGKIEYINEYGKLDTSYVPEEFILPDDAEKELVSFTYSKSKAIYKWTDSNENPISLEWIWIPEVWKGIRIGYNIYVDIGPVQHAYQSLLNPYETKLPIYGYIYNNRNAYTISLMDRMKPWQKLYYIIMARLLKLISQDRGVLTFINVHLLDKNIGFKESMRIAEDNGFVPYNPFSNTKGAGSMGLTNTMKVAERIDATNAGAIQHYINLLSFIEQNIKLASGMSDQRIGQTNARMTATDNYRDTMHSVNITEPLHAAHDLLWQDVLQGLMEMTLSVLSESTGKLRGFLNDEEKVLIDLDILSLEDNFKLRIADNSKAYKVLEQAKGLAHALVQNDKAGLDALVELLETENLSQFKTMIRGIEEDHQQRMQQRDQQQRDHEKEMAEMARRQSEDQQINELHKIYLKGKLDYNESLMKMKLQASSFDQQKDYNKDGIPDYMQWEQLEEKLKIENRKIDLEEFKLGMEQQNKDLELEQKELERKRQDQKDKMDREERNLDRSQKIQQEKIKSKKK